MSQRRPFVSNIYPCIRWADHRTNELHPDLIVLTGDYVPSSVNAIPAFAQLVGKLHAPLGVVAVLGNHDYWVDAHKITRAMTTQGITVLRNRSIPLLCHRQHIWLVGLDDYWAGSTDMNRALHGVPATETKILLVHEPDFADQAKSYPIDLQLSGHSHGGQVRIPLIGGLHYPPFADHYPIGLVPHRPPANLYQSRSRRYYTATARLPSGNHLLNPSRQASLIAKWRIGLTPASIRYWCRPSMAARDLHS